MDVFVPAYRKTSISLYILFFMCVFSYYGISFISERYFEEAEEEAEGGSTSSGDKYWEMAVTTVSELPGLLIGAFILDKIGRKNTMSFVSLSLSLFARAMRGLKHA